MIGIVQPLGLGLHAGELDPLPIQQEQLTAIFGSERFLR